MPLSIANINDSFIIKKVGGLQETKRHLEDLGFHEGARVNIISKLNNLFIVSIGDTRIALDSSLISKIEV